MVYMFLLCGGEVGRMVGRTMDTSSWPMSRLSSKVIPNWSRGMGRYRCVFIFLCIVYWLPYDPRFGK